MTNQSKTTSEAKRAAISYTDEEFNEAQKLVDSHNKTVCPDGKFCEKDRLGYLLINLTGEHRVYFTLYRYNNMAMPQVNPFQFSHNISTDLLTAVKQYATGKGLPIVLGTDDNFNPKAGYSLDGVPFINFGKHNGKTMDAIFESDAGYVVWFAKNFIPKNKKGRALLAHAKVLEEVHQQKREVYFQELTEQNQEECSSEYQGELKERREWNLTVYRSKDGEYSTQYFAKDKNDNLFHFFTKMEFEIGQSISVVGAVADHKERLGKKFTRINRVK